MKTIPFLLSIASALCFSISTFASEPIIYENITNTVNGHSKEITIFDEYSQKPSIKVVSYFNSNGQLVSKENYTWKAYEGWMENHKLIYNYDNEESKTPQSVVRVDWNTRKKEWSSKLERMTIN